MANVDYEDVMTDLKNLMTNSSDFWPADYGHYGPLFIRLAWHNAGSYRTSDGRGGADGARQRFEPERSWADNTNLDKARALLWPIKQKHGLGLSWGDLIVLSGNAAIESMGGPVFGFCGGRVDAADGSESVKLGPTLEQEMLMPCKVNGECEEPLGVSTIGLIYVNPEGHMGNPDPEGSAKDIRDVFGRMNLNDTETVALIGGGHAFGKAHGACPAGPGPSPVEDPTNSWPGLCQTGKGKDTYTSGFELPFTTRPTYWDNEYFHNLINLDWHVHKGPGNKNQWEPRMSNGMDQPTAPSADGTHNQTIGLLTSDVALMWKDEAYKSLVRQFADDMEALDHAFEHAWYKLTTRDMGPSTRCSNADAPPPQPFQYPLPDPPAQLADFDKVRQKIDNLLNIDDGEAIGMFTRLAWQCSSTFRSTDYLGGCNGARIRFSPQKDWSVNINIKNALELLEPIKDQTENLSWADLIVLAGNAALEKAGGEPLVFCGGRTDAPDGMGSEFLFPKITGNSSESLVQLKDYISIMGLTQREFVALNGAGYAVGDSSDCDGLYCRRNSFIGTSTVSSCLSNIFFVTLLSENWEEYTIPSTGKKMYKAAGKDLLMLPTDLMIRFDPVLQAIAQDFAEDNNMFLSEVAAAWTKLSISDRFQGPTGNQCSPP
eukprot:GFUD01008204.1.p1 GENE.GFUD01008204.1~~GFUD01008204.1.p1  ORF type:complete len:657 (+),score=134.32 GFUD01008204.1:264-2234(+)